MKKLPLVLALTLIASGCASSVDQTSAEAEAEAVARAQAEQTSVKPETEVEYTTCNIEENFGECFFGQTAIYEDSRRGGDEVLLEIAVQEPQKSSLGKMQTSIPRSLGEHQRKVLTTSTLISP